MKRLLLLAIVWAATTTIGAQAGARRIVSLAPIVTEVLFEAGLGPRVLGIPPFAGSGTASAS